MNFIEVFKEGKAGKNRGLSTGLPNLDRAIRGIQRKQSIGLAAAPKVGKTSLTDFAFLIGPYEDAKKRGILDNVNWIYFSYEVDRVSKEFKIAAYYMYKKFGVFSFDYKGVNYLLSAEYLMGKELHRLPNGDTELIPVSSEHEEMLKQVYYEEIVPLFGEYSPTGVRLKKGKIDFIENPENPTGLRNYLLHYSEQNGRYLSEKYFTKDDSGNTITKTKRGAYIPNNPELTTIIIVDHIRKLKRERGYSLKETIDKWLEYHVELRNKCGYTFVNICHSNRNVSSIERLKYSKEWIYPTSDDIKDSGNLAEESTIMLTMFNPTDKKYGLDKHMGVEIASHPNYRSLHLTDNRNGECPLHMQLNMFGNINYFEVLNN